MTINQQLAQEGVILLRNAITKQQLQPLIIASLKCYDQLESLLKYGNYDQIEQNLPSHYQFNPWVTSCNITALNDYREDNSPMIEQQILELLWQTPLASILTELREQSSIICNFSQSWLRKQYALANYHPRHHPHQWHQDGALGISFPLITPDSNIYLETPLTPLITCWLPLTNCGVDSPGLEFIKQNIPKLIDYHYLNDTSLRSSFESALFWSPQLNIGDILIFLNGTLHRTYVTPAMMRDRISIELRFMLI